MKKLIIILLVLLTACSTFFRNKTERVLAKVGKEYLYASDLKGVIPAKTSKKDSLVLAKSFIDNWVRQKLIISQAIKNLTAQQLDFSRQLENYQNSLIVFEYENALVKQKLDTIVTDEEMETYYDSNQKNFQLKDNIVQIRYVKLPAKSANIKLFRKLLNSDDADDRAKLADQCEKYVNDFYLDDQTWLMFSDVIRQVNIKTYNQEDFLKNHRYVESQDSLSVYLIRFSDFKIKESISPLSFEKDRIRSIILNKRKIDLISKMHQEVYDHGVKYNEFEVF
ncbi:MAG: hypothetical protein NTX61_14885 [Bacteroidetes bacterium]|nr:hypothetical protein [Bacteroidota bacterium]